MYRLLNGVVYDEPVTSIHDCCVVTSYLVQSDIGRWWHIARSDEASQPGPCSESESKSELTTYGGGRDVIGELLLSCRDALCDCSCLRVELPAVKRRRKA